MTPDEEIRQAKDADRLFNDPLFQRVLGGIESNIIENMRRVPMTDVDTQHQLVLSLQLLCELKGQFKQMLDTGKMAQVQKDTLLDRAKARLRPSR